MKRSDLEALPLEELYRLAVDRGMREASGLPRDVVIERLVDAAAAVAAPVSARDAVSTRNQRRHTAVPSGVSPDRPHEHDSESMARLYLEQGDPDRAASLYRDLLRLRPDDEALLAALAVAEQSLPDAVARAAADEVTGPVTDAGRPDNGAAIAEGLLSAAGRAPDEQADHGPPEPMGMLDWEEPPDAYGLDDCEVLFKDPHSLFVYWEVTESGLAGARRDLGDEASVARLVMRVFSHNPQEGRGPEREQRDHALDWNHGRRYFPSPRPGAKVRVAVGLVTPSGLFAPIAQSSQVKVPPADVSGVVATEWMEIPPARTRGREAEPVVLPDAARIIAGAASGARDGALPLPGQPRPSEDAHRAAGGGSERNVPPAPVDSGEPAPSSPWRWRPGSHN